MGARCPLREPSTVVWVVLTAATVLSWWLGGVGHGASLPVAVSSVAVLVVAFAKVRLVGLYFMELRDAPPGLRAIFECYVVVAGGVVIGMYLVA